MTREEFIKENRLQNVVARIKDELIEIKNDNDAKDEKVTDFRITTHYDDIPVWPEFKLDSGVYELVRKEEHKVKMVASTIVRVEHDNLWYLWKVVSTYEAYIENDYPTVVETVTFCSKMFENLQTRLNRDVYLTQHMGKPTDLEDEFGDKLTPLDPNQVDEEKYIRILYAHKI